MMKRISLMLLWLVAGSAFVHGDDPLADGGSNKPVAEQDDTFKVISDPAGKAYFPEGRASYYTKYLSAMKEPSLQSPLEKGSERVFRFTYLPSFDDPLAVRITDSGGKLTARAIRLKMDENYRPVKITHDKTWELDEEGRKAAAEVLVLQKDFWTPLSEAEEALSGLDGSQWIFEVHDKDGYRMIDVWSPGVLASLDKEMVKKLVTDLGTDPAKIRDFLVYETIGKKLLEIGGIRPDPKD